MENQDKNWPAWRYGPKGEAAVFEAEKDVPKGWHDHPAKHGSDAGAARTATQPANVTTTEKEAAKTTTEKGTSQDPAATANSGVGGEGKTAPSGNVELDTAGWPWTAELHASSKSKTKDGLWRMKVGVSRPDPKPGYPLDL